MVIERRWKTWVYFYIPLTLFVIGTLFPFYWMVITAIRPDSELYRSWRAVNNAPFWTLAPTLEHFRDLVPAGAWCHTHGKRGSFFPIMQIIFSIRHGSPRLD